MPSLDGAIEWLNSEPLDRAELRGRAVLVELLDAHVHQLAAPASRTSARGRSAYRDDGLMVIGVHTPEFSFEHDDRRVRRRPSSAEIDYPVAVDNDYAIWNAFDNHYWPALYFVDREGVDPRPALRRRTLRAVGTHRSSDCSASSGSSVPVEGLGVEAEADWDHLRSPETYLGYGAQRFASPTAAFDEHASTNAPSPCAQHWTLAGVDDRLERVVLEDAGGSIAYRFRARDAHLVLSPGTRDPIPFGVRLDGEPPGPSHGVDVDEDGNGVLSDGRLYQLVRQHDRVAERTLEITFLEPGAEAYVFTFG